MAAIIRRTNEAIKLEGEKPCQPVVVLKQFLAGLNLNTARKRNAAFSLVLIAVMQIAALTPAFAQTKPAQANQSQDNGSLDPSQAGKKTENTVPNQYEDAVGNLYRVDQAVPINQNNINDGVTKILTGNYAPVVFQAAEQGQGGDVQKAANNILNASLGSVNDTYRGLHQWFKDDLVGNLFSNIGQLIGKWLSELIDGWIADTAQFLAKFLRVFVLNPNIAVNGLNGSQNDGISPYIRQGADVMYGIAVDLLLLLFILCIWKFWADASWGGAGNLMGPVGRLIFTAGLLLAWPTLYAFEIQISNEMIKAIYFNSADQVLMLDYALAQAVKGGVIAAGAGATSVFAPLLANLAIPVAGQFVGSLFYFASIMIFTILGGILIAELVYILILKAVQTALLTAQYMFAPIFLVFFATPDTENYATGFVRAFVETSLWTFVWVGLLKVMTIILFSDFNPWGKILIAIGVLQLMIQVPSFLGRAQISPMSDFVTAGLVFGTFSKALGGLKDMSTSLVDKGVGWFTNDRFADKGLQQTKDAGMNGLPGQTANPELLNSLNKASQTERDKNKQGPGVDPNILSQGPGLKTPGTGTDVMNQAQGKNVNGVIGPVEKPDGDKAAANKLDAKGKDSVGPNSNSTVSTTVPPNKKDAADRAKSVLNNAGLAGLAGALAAGAEAGGSLNHGTGNPELPKGGPPDAGDGSKAKDRFEWGKSTPEGWNESNLIHVDTRKLLGQLTSVNGVGLRVGQSKTSALGSTAHGVQRVNIAEGASDSEMAHAIYSAAFANNVASDDPAKDAARKSAIAAGAHQPRGLVENMAANWLSNTGSSWNRTAISKERFQQAMFEAAVQGSQAYVSRRQGNAYTDYLRGRYGEWGDEQDAMAVHLITNPDSSESPWNRNIGPATDSLVSSGVPIGADTRGAAQNMAIQAMHPARRKQAIFAALSYTYQAAKGAYGNEHPAVFALAHGEMARALSADEVNNALTMYQITGQEDLNTTMAPQLMSQTSGLAAATNKDFATAYTCMATAAPYAARRMGYLPANYDISGIHSYSDLAAVIVPQAGQSHAGAMEVILEAAGERLTTMERAKVPMTVVTNPTMAAPVMDFLAGHAIGGLTSSAGARALSVVSKNIGIAGAPVTNHTLEAIYSWGNNGGNIDQLDLVHVEMAARAQQDRGSAGVKPHTIEVALNQGYGPSSGDIPWNELDRMAVPYMTGQVTDYRLAGVVSQLQGNNIPITRQNIQLAVESMSAGGGEMNVDQVRAVIRVTEATRSGASAPAVLETFARVQAAEHGLNTSNMNFGEVLKQLESIPGSNYSAGNMAAQIVQLSRQGGGFSDHQLQDPVTVELLLEQGNSHPYAAQAINVVTRVVGSTEARNNPSYINVVQEFLDNDGRMRDMDPANLNAAMKLAEAKAQGMSGPQAAEWDNVKISPSMLKMMQRDPGYSVTNNSLSDELIARLLRAANKFGP
ncbi:MAG: hypothetical protein K2X27_26705 [Candidatus Obscuribacterales bacterium]|nr:hypothetical protein [Candidatus Obscuribacterales bacterium]